MQNENPDEGGWFTNVQNFTAEISEDQFSEIIVTAAVKNSNGDISYYNRQLVPFSEDLNTSHII